MISTLQEWDRNLLLWLNNLGSEPFDPFWLAVTRIESWIPLFILLGVLIFYLPRNLKHSFIIFITILTVFASTFTIMEATKVWVQRVRPNNAEGLFELLRVLQQPTDFSFFSGHAASSFTVIVFLFCVFRKQSSWIYALFIWPLLFSFSRIYVGVHFPSDILVGAAIGSGLAVIGYRLLKRKFPQIGARNRILKEADS